MFAVKGWNVPTGQLQVQNAKDKPKKSQDGILDPSSSKKQNGDGNNKSKKRKRDGDRRKERQPVIKDQAKPRPEVPKQATTRPGKSHDKKAKNKSKPKAGVPSTPAPVPAVESPAAPPATSLAPIAPPALPSNVKLTPLQRSMRDKLLSSRFRFLNEQLYTTPSASSLKTFKENPSLYTEYHDGFTRQVASWPENPVELFYAEILDRAEGARKALGSQKGAFRDIKKGKFKKDAPQTQIQRGPVKPLPRDRRTGKCTIADLGCGDAKLASRLTTSSEGSKPLSQRCNISISSYDLSCPPGTESLITIADIANLPLQADSVDVAIFCLALMGTNWPDFIDEAYRILYRGGELWIAEVKSRFVSKATLSKALKSSVVEHSVGKRIKPGAATKAKDEEEEQDGLEDVPRKQETDTSPFIAVLRSRGFVLDGEVDDSNKMFVRMKFIKTGPPPTRGKHAHVDGGENGGVNGFRPKKKPKFLDDDEEVPGRNAVVDELAEIGLVKGEEARVLKRCLYKTR